MTLHQVQRKLGPWLAPVPTAPGGTLDAAATARMARGTVESPEASTPKT